MHVSHLQLRDTIIKENPVKSGFLQIGGGGGVSEATRSRFFTCDLKFQILGGGGGSQTSQIGSPDLLLTNVNPDIGGGD